MPGFFGHWINELQSTMRIDASPDRKHFTGIYNSKVGPAKGDYELVGMIDPDGTNNISLSWLVIWKNENGNLDSVTAWTGEYRLDAQGHEQIKTTWLLSCETNPANDWKATQVGQDIFTRPPAQ